LAASGSTKLVQVGQVGSKSSVTPFFPVLFIGAALVGELDFRVHGISIRQTLYVIDFPLV
jgi:hypothetical protein